MWIHKTLYVKNIFFRSENDRLAIKHVGLSFHQSKQEFVHCLKEAFVPNVDSRTAKAMAISLYMGRV